MGDDKAPFMASAAKSKTESAAKMEAYRGSEQEKAFKAQLKEWEAECDRRRAAALEKMEKKETKMDLEVAKKNKKGKQTANKKGNGKKAKGKGRGKKFVEESSSEDESDSESESESESGSESSSDEESS